MADDHAPSRLRAWFDWLVRDPATGESTLLQPANAPISVFWGTTAVQYLARPPEPWATGVWLVRWGALTYWAGDELFRGDSPLRHAMGAVTLAGSAAWMARELPRRWPPSGAAAARD